MNHKDKIEKLKEFKNEKEFREFLIDFLKKSGFSDVLHTHRYGSPEQGKDIIAKYPQGIEGFDWYAFVVKKGHIGGGTNEIETIKNQIKQSFEYSYVNIDGNKQKINKVKVVTNENFTVGAQTQLSSSPELKIYNNFSFWWNESLVDLITQHYSDFWLPGDELLKEYSKSFNTKIKSEFEIRELSIRKIENDKVKKLLNLFVEPQLTEISIDKNIPKEKKFDKKKITINDITESNNNFILDSEAGGGKTKILNLIGQKLTKNETYIDKKEMPVKLSISNIRKFDFDFKKIIENNIRLLTPEMNSKFEFSDFKYIILIDSIHLLSKKEQELLKANLTDFTEKNSSRFIITQRKNNNIEFTTLNNGLREVSINNFSQKQVESFIIKYFDQNDRGKRFIEILKESNLLSKLSSTPLTVTLLALLYDDNHYEIPATLTDIYDDFTNILLGKLEVKSKIDLLQLNVKKRIFTTFALDMLDRNKYNTPYSDFKIFVNKFLLAKGYQEQNDDELNTIINQSGLLYLDDENMVGFKQQAFSEYLSSIEIYDHKRKTHYDKLLEKFNIVSWQNTAIFYAGRSKDIPDMIDDLLDKMPNDNLKDWFINSGGMGYLSQALYLTDKEYKKKLVVKSLNNLVNAFDEMKKLTKDTVGIKDMPLTFLANILGYWFNENFKSITLKETLIEVFDDLNKEYKNVSSINFEGDFKMFLVASTLMNKYIDHWDSFDKLIERDSFIKNPILMVTGNTFLEIGDIDRKKIDKKMKDKIKKSITKHREVIKNIIKEPAYRFGYDYKLLKN